MDFDVLITQKLRQEEATERALHTPSGKLSASWLSRPLLEQTLKILGVPPKSFSDYSLRLFKRGKQVEDWVCSLIEGEEQVEVDYRGVIGFIDKVVKGVPLEVKSVKSSQWKWLMKQGPNLSYRMQAGLYALGTKSDHASILMVCADDFRTMQHEVFAETIRPEIDKIIDEVAAQIHMRDLPAFKGREDYHNKPEYGDKYSSYPDWISLTPELLMQKLETQYPDQYKKLKGEQ